METNKIDPQAFIDSSVQLGSYSTIGRANITTHSQLGDYATINNNTNTMASTIKTYNEIDENAFIAHCQFDSNKTSLRLFPNQTKTNEYLWKNLTVENTHSSRFSNIDSGILQFMCVILVLSFLERQLR